MPDDETGLIFDDVVVKINAINITGRADVVFCIPVMTSGPGTFSIKLQTNPSDPTPIFLLNPHYIPDSPSTSCEGDANILVNGVATVVKGFNFVEGTGGIIMGGAATGTEITTANFAFVSNTMVGGIRIDCEGIGFNVTNSTWSVGIPATGSGGIVMGGGFASNITEVGTGGITMGGEAITISILSFTGSGTIIVNGEADIPDYLYAMTGGIIIGGEAITINNATTATGGIIIGGEAEVEFIQTFVASGGIIVNGSAISQQNYFYTGSGIIFTNLGIPGAGLKLFIITGSGLSSLVLSGSAIVTNQTFHYNSVGFLFTGGSAQLNKTAFIYKTSGGVTLGGVSTQGFVLGTSGGITLGGEAIFVSTAYSVIMSGGIVINGDSEENIGIISLGSITVTGFASTRIVIPQIHTWSGFLRPNTLEERFSDGQVLNILTPGTNPNSFTIPHEVGVCIPTPTNTKPLRRCQSLNGQSSQRGAWIANVVLRRQAPFAPKVEANQGFNQVTPN